MIDIKEIKTALISVYDKRNIEGIVHRLNTSGIRILSTGGTKDFIENLGIPVTAVEELTSYPSILGGRVKTLHPKIFGGILARTDRQEDIEQVGQFDIPGIDLVIVDLYPFEETVASGAGEDEITEKIDIGGISLIRAAAKNFKDVLVISSRGQYDDLIRLLDEKGGKTSLLDRKKYALQAFNISSHYDTAIFSHFNTDPFSAFKQSIMGSIPLRYGENPHQRGVFFGDFNKLFDKLHGKEISYNNLLDIDAAVNLIEEFEESTFAILKHNNACGISSRDILVDAWEAALSGDPVSAFGGILIANREIDTDTAAKINKLFFEVIIGPSYQSDALEILKQKKNRIILIRKRTPLPEVQFRSLLNGVVAQDKDMKSESKDEMSPATNKLPTDQELTDLVFANKVVKHTKSNTIVLALKKQLLASGTGQTSRVDALKQAISKARTNGFDLSGAVMASDAFFPFSDCVEIAFEAGIRAVVQPGGSIRDNDSIAFCNKNGMAMVFTGIRHFRH
ncbi:MAG: bifunctional phosphoribosylaminoimidazolecarboxamide formyltransferase/IMP cyclohydrolase [Bacteroidetes bacterium]|nr:bifunctional phosphoribosylaminoimidazolecarboxamide formyltransferase/IMP cyclohydrolase [Bacteroidota bacterium]